MDSVKLDGNGPLRNLSTKKNFGFPQKKAKNNFFLSYCDGDVEEGVVEILAAQRGGIPLIIIVSFKFLDYHDALEAIDTEFLALFASHIQGILYEIREDEPFYPCVVALAPKTTLIGRVNHTLNIRFEIPNVHVENLTLLNKIKQKLRISLDKDPDIFSHVLREHRGSSWDEIILNPKEIPLYGSKWITEVAKEELFYVMVTSLTKDGSLVTKINNNALEGFSVPDVFADTPKEELLPVILSLTFPQKMRVELEEDEVEDSFEDGLVIPKLSYNASEREMMDAYLVAVNKERFKVRGDWILLGRAFHSVYGNSPDGLRRWRDMTPIASWKGKCDDLYEEFRTGNLVTVKSIAWMASKDDPPLYERIHRLWWTSVIDHEIIPHKKYGDMALAHLFYRKHWLKYLVSGQTWWTFNRSIWIEIDSDLVSLDLDGIYEELENRLIEERDALQEQEDPASGRRVNMSNIAQYLDKLRDHKARVCVLNASRASFKTKTPFDEMINQNDEVFYTANKCLECSDDGVSIIDPRPEDFATVGSDIEYVELSLDDPGVISCLVWLEQMYSDEGALDYFMKLLASSLRSGNRLKKMVILVSAGALDKRGWEAKTTLETLINMVYNTCAMTPPASIFAKPLDAEKANPALLACRHAKIVNLVEPSMDSTFNDGTVKLSTGGSEKAWVRGLYSSKGGFVFKSLPIVYTNNMPGFRNLDSALQDRIDFIPHVTRFTKDAPTDPEEQRRQRLYPADPNFKETALKKMRQPFLWLLVHFFNRFTKEGLGEKPVAFQTWTKDFWEERSPGQTFVNTHMEKDEDGYVKLDDAVRRWREWYRVAGHAAGAMKLSTPKDITSTLSKCLGNLEIDEEGVSVWMGWRLR